MFIGVIHDNSDMARIKRLATALLGMDISTAVSTGSIAIENFMRLDKAPTLYPMFLTCFYATDFDEIESMALIIGTEFFGSMKDEFTQARAKREIATRAAKISEQKDGTLKTYFTQFKEPEDVYWNFLAFLSLTHDSLATVSIGMADLADEECPIIHYSESLIGNTYVRGFETGRQQRKADMIATDPAFSNVAVLAPKK